jgi:hypothetical protein
MMVEEEIKDANSLMVRVPVVRRKESGFWGKVRGTGWSGRTCVKQLRACPGDDELIGQALLTPPMAALPLLVSGLILPTDQNEDDPYCLK